MIDKGLLGVLACPRCKSCLALEKTSLFCEKCGIYYEIKQGIPVLMPE